MTPKLKPLDRQIMVITGASSGIGLVTARMAAARGARLVLAARGEEALRGLVDEIRAERGEAVHVVADVGREEDVRRIAHIAREHFGGFDTWVNNAGISIYGKIEEVPLQDQRRLFDTNYWGVVHGSLVAVAHLRGRGGALVNVGSTLSDCAFPLQGPYSASKHAVKGFTDALRMELESDGAPVSVTLIKPGVIDTPFELHARNYLPVEPTNPPPAYAPGAVAGAILHAAEHRVRDLYVGGSAKAMSVMGRLAPRLADRLMGPTVIRRQQTSRPADASRRDSLYAPSEDGCERSGRHGFVLNDSLYTRASMHPLTTAAVAVGLGAAAAALWRRRAAARPEARARRIPVQAA